MLHWSTAWSSLEHLLLVLVLAGGYPKAMQDEGAPPRLLLLLLLQKWLSLSLLDLVSLL